MEQVIFTCLVPGGSCEWFHLRDFVIAFNALHGTSYSRSKCLDVYGRDNRQPAQASRRPEVLLESDTEDEPPIVIERKAVVWPSDFQRDHSKEHVLPDRVMNVLGEGFNDCTYQLAFHADDMKGKNKGQADGYADQIAQIIVSNVGKAKSSVGVGGRNPIRWGFRPLAPYEIDDRNPANGVRSLVSLPSQWDLDPVAFRQNRETALAGFAERFEREANKAGKKYDEYVDCQKLLVVQFFGESELVTDEGIIEIIKAARIPKQIDQVWLTGREYVSLDDYELAWECIR